MSPRRTKLVSKTVLVTVLLAASMIVGCEKPNDSKPDDPPPPCTSNTGTIRYTNNRSRPIRIIVDGVGYGYVSPGESKSITVAAGVPHTLQKFYEDGTRACSDSNPSVGECQTLDLSCG